MYTKKIYEYKRHVFIFIGFLLIIVIIGLYLHCSNNTEYNQITTTETSITGPEYADGFTIENHDGYKVLTLTDPVGSNDIKYLLVDREREVPAGYPDTTVIRIPLQNVAIFSTTHIPYIVGIGETNSIKAVNGMNNVNTPIIRERYNQGLISEVSTQDSSSMTTGLDAEKLININPEVVFVSYYQESTEIKKLQEIGLTPVVVSEWMEKTSLGRAEWMKFFAYFYDKEDVADKIFNEIEGRYKEASAKAKKALVKPSVLSGSNYQGMWYVPGGKSYTAKMFDDAGGNYLWADDNSTGSINLDSEAVYNTSSNADYWINCGIYENKEEMLADDERYSHFAPFKNDTIYNYIAKINEYGGNDYWETGIVEPDVILLDLIKIMHPEIVPDHELSYYKHVILE